MSAGNQDKESTVTTIQTWQDLVDLEARLPVLLDAALAILEPRSELNAENVYCMCKPLVGWLVGPQRGRPPAELRELPPAGSLLLRLFDAARPFTAAPSPLDDRRAYDVATRHLNGELHVRQEAIEAGRESARTLTAAESSALDHLRDQHADQVAKAHGGQYRIQTDRTEGGRHG